MSNVIPKRREAKKEQSRQKIIEATVACIAAHGLVGVTVSRICEESGLSRGMINAHFDSKEKLLLEVLKSIAEDYLQMVDVAISRAGDDPAEAFQAEISAEITFWMNSHTESCAWFAFRAAALSNPEYMAYCGPREATLYAVPKRLCCELVQAGPYPDIDPDDIARGLTAMLEGFWFDWVSYPEDFDPESTRNSCLAFLKSAFPKHF